MPKEGRLLFEMWKLRLDKLGSCYCNDYQECVIGHSIMKSYKDHRVLALNDFQDKDYEDVMKRPTFCLQEDHNKEELKYFCKTCEIPVCQICVTLDHSGHIMKLVKD